MGRKDGPTALNHLSKHPEEMSWGSPLKQPARVLHQKSLQTSVPQAKLPSKGTATEIKSDQALTNI